MIKIAIIEDDVTISQMYRMKFEATGFDVRLASDGVRGFEMVESFRPDLILLDMQMPEKDGYHTLKDIREQAWGKTIPVIILTNLGKEEAPKGLHDLGIESYIVKAELTPSQVVQRAKETLKIE